MSSGGSSRVPGDAGGRAESVPCRRDRQKAPPCSEQGATRGKSEREMRPCMLDLRCRSSANFVARFGRPELRSHCEHSRTRRNWAVRVVAVVGFIWGGILKNVVDKLRILCECTRRNWAIGVRRLGGFISREAFLRMSSYLLILCECTGRSGVVAAVGLIWGGILNKSQRLFVCECTWVGGALALLPVRRPGP